MKPYFLLLAVLILSTASAQKADKRLDKLDAELTKVLSDWHAAGFSVAVVEKGQMIYARGFGYRDYEKKLPADGKTIYAIGSCSKAFTAALLGVLRGENKVDFNKSPREYIPYLEFYNDELNNEVRIKDMMTHMTGLPRHDFSWYLNNAKSKDSLLMRVKYMEPFTGVREQWYYNNFMFLGQGVIAEKITGKSWEENIKEKFFTPLGMTTSSLDINGLKNSPNAAVGYEVKNKTEVKKMDYYDISGMAPAGSINSSVSEMAMWLITWIHGGNFRGKEIFPAPYASEAMSSQAVIGAALPSKEQPDLFMANYGYGWMVSSYKGHYRVEHGGNIDGFSASTSFYPADSLGIVVLSNQNGSVVPSIVRNMITDRMLNVKRDDWTGILKKRQQEGESTEKLKEKPQPVAGTRPSHALAAYAGEYSNPGYAKFKIVLQHDSLFLKFAQQPKMNMWLKHWHYDVFKPVVLDESGKVDSTADLPELTLNFATDNKGDIKSVAGQFEPALDHPIVFDRKATEIKVDKATLVKYEGEYAMGAMTAKVYIKGEKTLFLFVQGQPEYELMATGKDQFTIKSLNGFDVEFQTEEGGKFKECIFKQPNGTFKATRK